MIYYQIRKSLIAKLQTELGSAAANRGIKVIRVEISDISVPKQKEKKELLK